MTRPTLRAIAWRAALISLALVALAWLWLGASLLASRARLDASLRLGGLEREVVVERDALGVPTINAASRADAARALGFLHAQERFFQMDQSRRVAAGRLAELTGPAALNFDRWTRPLDLQRVADEATARLPERHARLIEAYAQGVNAGLGALAAPPPEYLALRAAPEPWRPRDTYLVALSMHLGLSREGAVDISTRQLRDALPRTLVDFLTPRHTRWDVLLVDADEGYAPLPIPGPEVVDLREAEAEDAPGLADPAVPGSNNWAVAGARTVHGGAILADDMHLGLRVPNVWYRAHVRVAPEGAPERFAVGVTLPGAPGVVAGSNGSIAWGHTNVTGDFLDWIDLVPDPADPNRYLTAAGSEAFGSVTHTIEVAGRAPTTLTRRTTRWGVVTDGDDERPDRVMLWTALDPARHTFGILDLFEADTLERGLDIAARWLGPPQNVVIASADGRIGWTISGAIPVREGFQGDASVCSDTLDRAWIGDLAPQDKPRVIDPPAGFLVTANSRTVGGAAGDRIGSNWALGVRSHRIAEVLAAAEATDERAMLDLQLDTDGGWLELYRELALGALGDDPPSDLARAREILEAWNGTADADQPGHALVRWFRARLSSEVVASILQRFEGSRQWKGLSWFNVEEAVQRILEERPDHLIPPPHETWRDAHLAALREAVVSMGGPERLDRPWGERNRLDMRHAFTEALGAGPFGVLGRLLDMPNHSQPGATRIVRVAGPGFGASQRLVVSPGREDLGILHMPGGQAGHFLSRHYRLGHEDWAEGRPTPLLPGEPRHRLRLRPQAR